MAEKLPRPNDTVTAVIPTFGPDLSLLDRLALIAAQVHSLIVVDDGSPSHADDVLTRIEGAGYRLVRQDTNRGIAAALNTGVRLALEEGAAFVLTVDQDSILPPGYVEQCLAAFAMASPTSRVGVVCSDRINGTPSRPSRFTAEGLGIVPEAIQSGFLISRACLEECGLFDERLFIDAVDTEFCLRIAEHGYLTVIGPGTDIIHALGEQALLRPFGFTVVRDGVPARYQYHRPFRRYFIVRNNIDLYLRYFLRNPHWVASSVRREIRPGITTIVAGPQRLRQLTAAFIGAAHGLTRKRGPLSPRLRMLLATRLPVE